MMWLLVALGTLAVFYSLFANDLIRSAFAASEAGQPVAPFIDHTRHTVDYYLARADLIFWQYLCVGLPLTIAFWMLLIRFGIRQLRTDESGADRIVPERFRFDSYIAFALYAALTAIYFAPNLATFNSALIGPPEDNMAGYWSLWWALDQSLRGEHGLTFSNFIYFPEGSSLYYFAWSFYNLGVAAIARLILDPVATFNFIVLHGYPIAGLGAFLLVRRVTGNSWIALIGGFMFAFSPNHFARTQHHLHINSIQFIPFLVLAFWDCIRFRRMRDLALAALFFLLNALCDWTYLIMAGYFIACGYLYLAIRNRRWFLGDYLGRSALIIGATIVVLSPWLVPMIKLGLDHPETDVGGRNSYVADLAGLVVPSAYHWSSSASAIKAANESYTGNDWEATAYLGLSAIIIVALAGKPLWRLASRWWIALLAFLSLALGPQLHLFGKSLPLALPYTVIAYIPFLSNLRAPARFMVYVYLFWAVIVSVAVALIWKRLERRQYRILLGIGTATLLVIDYFAINHNKTGVVTPPALLALQADHAPMAILNLPHGYVNSMRFMMQQTQHRIPIVEGAATRQIGKSLVDTLELSNLARQQRQLQQAGVSHIVIHKELLPDSLVDPAIYRSAYGVVTEDSLCLILRVSP